VAELALVDRLDPVHADSVPRTAAPTHHGHLHLRRQQAALDAMGDRTLVEPGLGQLPRRDQIALASRSSRYGLVARVTRRASNPSRQ
jgi:hypothetical protein